MTIRILLALLCAATAAFSQDSYRIRPGQPARVDAPAGTQGRSDAGILVAPDADGRIIAAAPVNTPPGEYDVPVTAPGRAASKIHVTVGAVARPATGSVPVVFLNGFAIASLTGGCPPAFGPTDTFGDLPNLLTNDGIAIYFFDNCVEGPGDSIEALGAQLGQFIGTLHDDQSKLVPQVDLVAHSMGGLIARAYLAGLQPDGSLAPPYPTKVRKFVEIATPNFGAYIADANKDSLGAQPREMIPGSPFLERLATWNQRHDDLRGVDALAIVGNGGYAGITGTPPEHGSDGVLSTTSGSLGFTRAPERTRLLPYCHIDSSGLVQLFVNCGGTGIAKAPETHTAVRSFLADTDAWKSVGTAPGDDPLLSHIAGLYVEAATAGGDSVGDLTAAAFGTTALAPSTPAGAVFYNEFISGTETVHYTSTASGMGQCGPVGPPAGYFTVVRCKSGPDVSSVGPLFPGDGAVVRTGGSIMIAGTGFGPSCPSCTVTANPGGVSLAVSSWTDTLITATLPDTFLGLVTVEVRNAAGADTIHFFANADTAIGNPPHITSVVNGASFLAGIQSRSWVTIRGTDLAPTTRTWNAAAEIINRLLPTKLDGVSVTINGKPAVVYYISATQLNVLAPDDNAVGPVTVLVSNDNGVSNAVQATLAAFAPGFFTFDPQDGRYAAAQHADYSLLGPADLYGGAAVLTPAQPGEVILLYASGFGPTDPPVPAGQEFHGAAFATGDISITIGGKPADIQFKGVVSNGLYQFNITVPELADGDHAIGATAGGVVMQQSVFLAVKN